MWNRPSVLGIIVLPTNIHKERLFHMYIITYACELENQKNYEIEVEAPLDFMNGQRRW